MKKNIFILVLSIFILFCMAAAISAACAHTETIYEPVPGDQDYHQIRCTNSECKKVLKTQLHTCSNWSTTTTTHSGTCNSCGFIINSISHSFDWENNNTKHWQECSICKYQTDRESHSFEKLNSTSQHWQRCSGCGYTTTKESHILQWTYNPSTHWQGCEDCAYTTQSSSHTYGSQTAITVDSHTKICTVCNYNRTEFHSVAAWAITPNTHRGTCTVCGYTVNEEHYFSRGTCTKCGVSEGAVLDMIEQGIEEMTVIVPTAGK